MMGASFSQKKPDALHAVYSRFGGASKREVAVGFPRGKVEAYPETGESVAEVAAQHVYGVGVPVRDFMGEAQSAIRANTSRFMRSAARLLADGDTKGAEALFEAAGLAGADAIKSAIVDGSYQEISERTYQERKKKGRDSRKPLIDTGHMLRSVTYVVREGAG